MNFKNLTLLAALIGSSVVAFASPSINVSHDLPSHTVRHHGDRIIRYAPPPLRHEYRGHRPHRHTVWVSGYWTHHYGRHVWVPGHWARIPHGRHAWVQPRWERRPSGYLYIDGYWR